MGGVLLTELEMLPRVLHHYPRAAAGRFIGPTGRSTSRGRRPTGSSADLKGMYFLILATT